MNTPGASINTSFLRIIRAPHFSTFAGLTLAVVVLAAALAWRSGAASQSGSAGLAPPESIELNQPATLVFYLVESQAEGDGLATMLANEKGLVAVIVDERSKELVIGEVIHDIMEQMDAGMSWQLIDLRMP
jgi:hypothetical protein